MNEAFKKLFEGMEEACKAIAKDVIPVEHFNGCYRASDGLVHFAVTNSWGTFITCWGHIYVDAAPLCDGPVTCLACLSKP